MRPPYWSEETLAISQVGDRVPSSAAILRVGSGQPQVLLLASYQAPKSGAMALRVTLRPMERLDGLPIYTIAVGGGAAPVVPPQRAGWTAPRDTAANNGVGSSRTYARVSWGVGGAEPSVIVCDWPVAGAAFDLVASNVKVEAIVSLDVAFSSGPLFSADVGPAVGMAPGGYAALGFTQSVDIEAGIVEAAIPEFATGLLVTDDGFTAEGGDSVSTSGTAPTPGAGAVLATITPPRGYYDVEVQIYHSVLASNFDNYQVKKGAAVILVPMVPNVASTGGNSGTPQMARVFLDGATAVTLVNVLAQAAGTVKWRLTARRVEAVEDQQEVQLSWRLSDGVNVVALDRLPRGSLRMVPVPPSAAMVRVVALNGRLYYLQWRITP